MHPVWSIVWVSVADSFLWSVIVLCIIIDGERCFAGSLVASPGIAVHLTTVLFDRRVYAYLRLNERLQPWHSYGL